MTGKLYKIQIRCRTDIKNEIYITVEELLLNPISRPIRFYRVRLHTSFTPLCSKLWTPKSVTETLQTLSENPFLRYFLSSKHIEVFLFASTHIHQRMDIVSDHGVNQ